MPILRIQEIKERTIAKWAAINAQVAQIPAIAAEVVASKPEAQAVIAEASKAVAKKIVSQPIATAPIQTPVTAVMPQPTLDIAGIVQNVVAAVASAVIAAPFISPQEVQKVVVVQAELPKEEKKFPYWILLIPVAGYVSYRIFKKKRS